MADLTESPDYEPGIYQIELTDPVVGGAEGISNRQAKQLANRTAWLKTLLESIQTGYAPKASPALTGTPTAPTAPFGDSTTKLANTKYVQDSFTYSLATEMPLMAGAAAVGGSPKLAREDHRHPTDSTRAPLASPALTGTPTAPTAAPATNNTQIASTGFVKACIAALAQATEAVIGVAKVATQALVNAGADDTTIVTPLKLRWGFSASLASNGYIVFPSWLAGVILQWGGTPVVGANSSASITYPLAFPNAIGACVPVGGASSTTVGAIGIYSFGSKTGFTAWTGAVGVAAGLYIAIGW